MTYALYLTLTYTGCHVEVVAAAAERAERPSEPYMSITRENIQDSLFPMRS